MKWKKIKVTERTRNDDNHQLVVNVIKYMEADIKPSWGYAQSTEWNYQKKEYRIIKHTYKITHIATGFSGPWHITLINAEKIVEALDKECPTHFKHISSYTLTKVKQVYSETLGV